MESIEPVVTEIVEESGPSSFVLFLIFVPTFLVAYLVPLLATLYSKNNAKKWIFYWLSLLAANYLLRPLLNLILSPYIAAFLFMVVAILLVYFSSNEKVLFIWFSHTYGWRLATWLSQWEPNSGITWSKKVSECLDNTIWLNDP